MNRKRVQKIHILYLILLCLQRMITKSPELTIVNVQPLTVYCVQARVFMVAMGNKSSEFSDKLCEKTRPGENLPDVFSTAGVDKKTALGFVKKSFFASEGGNCPL